MNIIDLEKQRTEAKKKRSAKKKAAKAPASDCVLKMHDGGYFKFSANYQYSNKNWSFYLWAKSKKEAEKRVMAIKCFPIEIVQIHDEIPQ